MKKTLQGSNPSLVKLFIYHCKVCKTTQTKVFLWSLLRIISFEGLSLRGQLNANIAGMNGNLFPSVFFPCLVFKQKLAL